MKDKNPWLGLLSYQDPEKSNSRYKFCGRETAISSLFAMIDNNLLVTMYGKTGIGKTSILNAGVFPLLRSRNYLPLSIRLGKYDNSQITSFAKCIVDEIISEIKAINGKIITKYPDFASENCLSTEFLWRFFLTSNFQNSQGEAIFPVITLDQFEEIFLSAPKESTLLLKQIYALIDDNREVPDIDGYSDYANFRFVFSIREDDLFYLEDCIDINFLSEMKQNRFRLCPLSESEAREVVMLGKEMMVEGLEDEIAVRTTNLSKDENGHVSTNLLSLVCSQLYIQSSGQITIDILNSFSQNPLESFYLDCMSHVSEKTRNYIEDQMVDQDRRKFVSKKDILKNISPEDIATLTSGEYKIFQNITAGNTECVELIHDSIARTIFHLKKDAEDRRMALKLIKHNKWIKVCLYAISICLIFALGVIALQYQDNIEMQEINEERPHNFVINIVEDSIVVVDNDFWKAEVIVTGYSETKIDTIKKITINKGTKDEPIDIAVQPIYSSIRVITNYKLESNYRKIDTTLAVSDLTSHPSIILPVQRILPELFTYSSKVVFDISGKEIDAQDAIVILHDKIQRTNSEGFFTFNLEDPIAPSDFVYIVRKGFDCYEENNLIIDGKFKDKFVIQPSDGISAFDIECTKMDSLKNTKKWKYKTISEKIPNGEWITFKDGSRDHIILYATIDGYASDDKYAIFGYYYFQDEYNKNKDLGKVHNAYHLFTGWMDCQDLMETKASEKEFEIHSYDVAGNKQTIYGHYMKNGRLSGKVLSMDETIGIFGNYTY